MKAQVQDEWIGVAEVAIELAITPRQAWELIKKLGVPCIGPVRDVMRMARFSRADWEEARDRSKAPPTPRGGKGASHGTVGASQGKGRGRQKAVTPSGGDSLSAWRKGRGA